MKESDVSYMIEAIVIDLVDYLTIDRGFSISDSLNIVYNSETYSKLKNPRTGLYIQSSKYVYSYLIEEIDSNASDFRLYT